jgi:hypothetical protein
MMSTSFRITKIIGTITNIPRLSISGGTAGNAEQEALDVFSALDLTKMAAVDPVSLPQNHITYKILTLQSTRRMLHSWAPLTISPMTQRPTRLTWR